MVELYPAELQWIESEFEQFLREWSQIDELELLEEPVNSRARNCSDPNASEADCSEARSLELLETFLLLKLMVEPPLVLSKALIP